MTSIESTGDEAANQAGTESATQENIDPGSQPVSIKWRGEDIDLTLDKVTELAQKGYDYEKKTAELSEQRRLLEERSTQLTGLDEFQSFLEGNPDKAAAIQRIITGETMIDSNDFDGEMPSGNSSDLKVMQLENQLKSLMAQQQESLQHSQLETLRTKVEGAVSQSPVLSRSSAHAVNNLFQEMARDPSQDLEILVKHLESTFNKIIENPTADQIEAGLRDRARFGTESGGAAAGSTPDIPNLSAEDMKKGGTHKAAVEYLQGLMGGH